MGLHSCVPFNTFAHLLSVLCKSLLTGKGIGLSKGHRVNAHKKGTVSVRLIDDGNASCALPIYLTVLIPTAITRAELLKPIALGLCWTFSWISLFMWVDVSDNLTATKYRITRKGVYEVSFQTLTFLSTPTAYVNKLTFCTF